MAQIPTDPPWLSLPHEVTTYLRPIVADVVELIIETIPRYVPVYAMPMEGRFGQGVRQGVSIALHRFLDLPGTDLPALSEGDKWVYERLGRGEVRSGRSLESLLAAYRTGARVTFRAISRTIPVDTLAPEVLLSLGESLFAYIDELSAASAQGYAAEQSERAGEHHRLRAELVEMILRGDTSEGTVARAAAAVGWAVPEVVVAVMVPFPHVHGLRSALGPDALVVERGVDVVVLIPFSPGRVRRVDLKRALKGRRAIIGPSRPLARASESLHLALAAGATGLVEENSDDEDGVGPLWVEDHFAEIIIRAEPLAMADLAAKVLAPLDAVRPSARERLAETLLAWLRHHGQRTPVAEELFVHQQTVGYRVSQLKDLFGAALDDPETRFELELVLRAGHR
jgi:hypothetical protein